MEDETKAVWSIVGICVVVFLILTTLIGGLVFTNSGDVNVVLQFGKVVGYKTEGLSFKMPLIESVETMSIRTQLFKVEKTSAASKDIQEATTSISLNYHITPQQAGGIYKNLGKHYIEVYAHPAIQEILKSTTARYNAEDLILKREQVKNEITQTLSEHLLKVGVIVDTLNITDFQFSPKFQTAIEEKAAQAQSVLQAEQKLRQIEVEARQAEQRAKGEASAAIAVAEGQVKAIQILSEALTPEYLRYLYIDKLAKDAKIIVVPDGMPLVLGQ